MDKLGCVISDVKRPEQWAILSEELAMLSNAMAQIPYEQREVLTLYMQGDMTFRQIAKIQNASINTVQGRYRYGLNKLRSILNSELDK
jgi:RNA polymerase sigma-70 factor (ECF subfamily)